MIVNTTYTSEKEKLQLIALGNKKTLEWLYKNCFITTKKMVVKFGGTEQEAWDIFQDAVTILYEQCKNANFELSCSINTYVTSICKNLWLKKNAKNVTKPITNEWEEIAGVEEDVSIFLQKEEQFNNLYSSLEQLGEPCSTLLKAFYFQKKSMQEISELFGYTNAENAKNQKFKCLSRLKKIFNKASNNL